MLTNLLQSIGIVFSLILLVALVLVTFYFSYILAIGILLIGLIYIVYQAVGMFRQGQDKSPL